MFRSDDSGAVQGLVNAGVGIVPRPAVDATDPQSGPSSSSAQRITAGAGIAAEAA